MSIDIGISKKIAIRTLDVHAPASYTQFGKPTSITDEAAYRNGTRWCSNSSMATRALRAPHALFKVANEADDQPTADLATQRMQQHEKTAWMLRSLLR